jgi:hypothetical protein
MIFLGKQNLINIKVVHCEVKQEAHEVLQTDRRMR